MRILSPILFFLAMIYLVYFLGRVKYTIAFKTTQSWRDPLGYWAKHWWYLEQNPKDGSLHLYISVKNYLLKVEEECDADYLEWEWDHQNQKRIEQRQERGRRFLEKGDIKNNEDNP